MIAPSLSLWPSGTVFNSNCTRNESSVCIKYFSIVSCTYLKSVHTEKEKKKSSAKPKNEESVHEKTALYSLLLWPLN